MAEIETDLPREVVNEPTVVCESIGIDFDSKPTLSGLAHHRRAIDFDEDRNIGLLALDPEDGGHSGDRDRTPLLST